MIRRSTIVYLLILLVVAGVYFYLKYGKQPDETADIAVTLEPTEEISYLFTATDGLPTDISILAKEGTVVEVARASDGSWVLKLPVKAQADQAASEAAASQATTIQILDTVPGVDLDLVGVTSPSYILNVKFSSGVERTIKVGVVTPTESGYYAQDAAGGDVMILSKSSLDALFSMLTTPPYLETPTASPIPSETPLPSDTPEATNTPDETATPQS